MGIELIAMLAALAAATPAAKPTAEQAAPPATTAQQQQVSPEALELVDRATLLADENRFAEALADLDNAIAIEPEFFEAWAMRGWVQVMLAQEDAAVESFARADALAPLQPMTLRGRGTLALRRGDFAGAIAYFDQSLRLDPGNAYALANRASARGAQGQFGPALADAEAAIAALPDYFPAHMLRIGALAELGREQEAIAAVDDMLATFPNNPQAQAAASEVLGALGQEDRSQSLLEASIDGGETAIGLYNMAMRREISETETKLRELNRALELAPDFSAARFERAKTLWADYRLREALTDLDRLVASDPLFFAAYDLRAQILFEQGRHADIATLAGQLLERYPENPDALATAIALYANIQRFTRAREVRESLRAIAPDHPFALTQGNNFFPER